MRSAFWKIAYYPSLVFSGVVTVLHFLMNFAGLATLPDDLPVAFRRGAALLEWIAALPTWAIIIGWAVLLIYLFIMAHPTRVASDSKETTREVTLDEPPVPKTVQSIPSNVGLIPDKFILRCKMNKDGYDFTALLFYRNRSRHVLRLSGKDFEVVLDGKPMKDSGLVGDLPAETTQSIYFGTVRIYDPEEISGMARATLIFTDVDDVTRFLTVVYYFKVLEYPKNESVDLVPQLELTSEFSYK